MQSQMRVPSKYNKVNQQKKYHLLSLVYRRAIPLRDAAQIVGINFLTAKTILFFHKNQSKSYRFDLNYQQKLNHNRDIVPLTATVEYVRWQGNLQDTSYLTHGRVQVVCSTGSIVSPSNVFPAALILTNRAAEEELQHFRGSRSAGYRSLSYVHFAQDDPHAESEKLSGKYADRQGAMQESESAHPLGLGRAKSDLDIVRYPVLFYFVAFLLLAASGYLLYSALGGPAGIPGFSQNRWWQFIVAVGPALVSGLIFFFAEVEGVSVAGEKLYFWKYLSQKGRSIAIGCKRIDWNQREVSELLSVVIVKRGYEMITFTNASFILVFNFKAFSQLQALACSSEVTALEYLSQLMGSLPQLRNVGRPSLKDIVLQE